MSSTRVENFSKVSALLNSLFTLTIILTFEKFYQKLDKLLGEYDAVCVCTTGEEDEQHPRAGYDAWAERFWDFYSTPLLVTGGGKKSTRQQHVSNSSAAAAAAPAGRNSQQSARC